VTPEFTATAASVRHYWRIAPPRARRRWWCAERDGVIVGWANAGLVTETSEPGAGWIGISVHPDHRGRGVGSELAERAEAHAREIGVRRLRASSRGDEASTAFARGRGYARTGSADVLVVDPRLQSRPEPPAGVELVPFCELPDPEPIYHVDVVSMADEPGELTLDRWELDVWLERFWESPLLDLEASMLVLVDGTPTTVTWVNSDRERRRSFNNGTGTLPEHRGRGLALLAKRASLARLAELGVTAVYTGNDVTNAPMLAINRKLGYAPTTTLHDWAKDIDG